MQLYVIHSKTSKYVFGTFPFCEPRSAINQSGSSPGTLYTVISFPTVFVNQPCIADTGHNMSSGLL